MPDTTTQQLVVFTLGDEHYALAITDVQEIIRFTKPRSLTSPDPSVRGVISLRGRIVPVYDLAVRLGVAHEDTDDPKILIVEAGGEVAGVLVDDVDQVITVDGEQLEEPPTDGTGVDAIAKVGDRLILLLTPESVLAPAGTPRPAATDVDVRVAA